MGHHLQNLTFVDDHQARDLAWKFLIVKKLYTVLLIKIIWVPNPFSAAEL